jgi:glycine/D-amino acid oxidase-like deaminating enzyme
VEEIGEGESYSVRCTLRGCEQGRPCGVRQPPDSGLVDLVDAVVIGGGFYGTRVALMLARSGLSVKLMEREARILSRASLLNQARVHNGYHYPRSILTSLRSRVNYARFVAEYPGCVVDDFTHYYAIGRGDSKITAAQFVELCKRIDAPVAQAPDTVRALFDARRIDAVFEVRECAFDARKLAAELVLDLGLAGVDVLVGTEVVACRRAAGGQVEVASRDLSGAQHRTRARLVFNCTYSGLNAVLANSGAEQIPMKRELAELALAEPPAELRGIGVTVMDGPFFSFMPHPPRPGLYTLSHVRYTPHRSWTDERGGALGRAPADVANGAGHDAGAGPQVTRFAHMLRDAERYLPVIGGARYVDSLWEVKALLPRSEGDDSRPILFRESEEIPGLVSVLGAKIDNVYDVEESVRALLARSMGSIA